jgi:hypothetical protein
LELDAHGLTEAPLGPGASSAPRGPVQRRKNPLPAVGADQSKGILLIEHGEPQDPCPVAGCRGTLRFLHRGGRSYVVCSLQPDKHGRPSPWGEDDAWWRLPEQQSPYTGAVSFMTAWSDTGENTPRGQKTMR